MSGYSQNTQQSAHPGPTPPASAPAAAGVPQGPVIAGIVGAVIALIGSFLAWSTVDGGELGTESSSGMKGDGLWTLIAAIVAAGLFAAVFLTRKHLYALISLVPSAVVLIVAVLNFVSPDRAARADLKDQGADDATIDQIMDAFDVSAGVGVYATLLGALVALGAGAFVAVQARKA